MSANKSKQPVRKKYSPQFKDRVLERIAKDSVRQVAKDLGLLYSWKAQQKKGGDSLENQKLQQAELARLKRENAMLVENAFLKKAAAYSLPQTIIWP